MRKIFWSIKKRIALLDKTPRIIERMGAKWHLDPKDWLQLRLIINKPFEVEQLAYFKKLCRERTVSRFFDCGANFGLYSILISKEFSNIETIAFEPVSFISESLQKNISLNNLDTRISIHPYALSNEKSTSEIQIDSKSLGISSLSPDQSRDYDMTEEIDIRVFDDEFKLKDQNLAFKIDVEGHEISAIKGMKQTFINNKCVIQIETRPENNQAVTTFFKDIGYEKMQEITEDLYFCN